MPEGQRSKLDDFFYKYPEVAALFTREKYVGPAAWHGVLDAETAKHSGWTQTGSGQFEYCTTPNTHFPDTYDAQTQLWDDRPRIQFFEETPEEVRERSKYRSRIYDIIDEVLKPLDLKNETDHSGNIVISLHPHDIEYVVWGTWRAWTTYPQVASRYFTARGVQQYLNDMDFKKIQVPAHYLYHVPGRLHDLTDSNWLVVSEVVRNQLSKSDMRKAFVRMNMIYVLLDEESGVIVSDEKLDKMLAEFPVFAQEDSCKGVCYRTIRDIRNKAISQAEIEDACACIREMHRFLRPENSFLWKPFVQWNEQVVDGAGDAIIKETTIVLVQKDDGTHMIYLTDFEMPSIAGPMTDEKRCMEFTGERDGLLTFAKYLQQDLLQSWKFLTTPE